MTGAAQTTTKKPIIGPTIAKNWINSRTLASPKGTGRAEFPAEPTSSCMACPSGVPDRPPHALRRCRHVDVLDAERGEGVEDGVDDRLRRRHAAGLARALDAERVGRGRHFGEGHLELRQVVGARQ